MEHLNCVFDYKCDKCAFVYHSVYDSVYNSETTVCDKCDKCDFVYNSEITVCDKYFVYKEPLLDTSSFFTIKKINSNTPLTSVYNEALDRANLYKSFDYINSNLTEISNNVQNIKQTICSNEISIKPLQTSITQLLKLLQKLNVLKSKINCIVDTDISDRLQQSVIEKQMNACHEIKKILNDVETIIAKRYI